MLENERNGASHLRPAGQFDAQWNDDGHNIIHPLLTGEREGYYEDFCDDGARKLATVLHRMWVDGAGFRFGKEVAAA